MIRASPSLALVARAQYQNMSSHRIIHASGTCKQVIVDGMALIIVTLSGCLRGFVAWPLSCHVAS